MRHLFPTLGLALALAAPAARAQTPAWTGAVQATNPAPTNDTGASGNGLAVDAAGSQYVAGSLKNGAGSGAPATRVFGSTSLTGGSGFGSGFVAKLSATQQWQWALRATGNGEEVAFEHVAVSPAGDTYAAGYVAADDLISPNGGTLLTVGSFTYTTTRPQAAFVTRLNASGQPQWLAGVSGVYILATGWDAAAGNLVVVGVYERSPVFGATTLPAPAGTNTEGLFVARLNAAGQWVSAVGVTSTGAASSSRLAVSSGAVGPQGQAAVAFRVRNGSVTLGSTVINSTSATVARNVVAQLNAANQWTWATEPTVAPATASVAYITNGLRYDRTGNLWLAGEGNVTGLQLGSTPVNEQEFFARLSPTGQWGAVGIIGHAGSTLATNTEALAVDATGNAVVIAELPEAITYTFGTRTLANPTAGRKVVARFNPTALVWDYAQLAPAPSNTGGGLADYDFQAAAFDAAGTLHATGSLGGNITFGNTTLANPSASGTNVFVARLGNAGALQVRPVAGAAPLALWPNPVAAGAAATLRLPAPAATARPAVLRDALGRAVAQATVPAGRQEVALPTAGLAPGLYLLEAGGSRAQVVVE